ncbi:PREDICTED: uncharacterized protein LOC107342710 isoform X1 [Acropora digitifera]|uniref:uncharacterized protein LOC107342710 isoform X1 n=1 Tax=Acropora digitifera TaxID=70779 RepID=UPI00077AF2AD|nr:PREDICTED: uncharacterized protein LOC107342710 isoform X1 [Acropora digitifera]
MLCVVQVMLESFKSKVTYLFIALMILRCCGLQMVGSCTFQLYIDKARQCTTDFITNLQTDKSVDCKIIYDKMVECTKGYVRECVRDHVPADEIEAFLIEATKRLNSEDFYCEDGLFAPPVLTDEQKNEIPCNETFYAVSSGCGESFQTKFRSNRADKTLCEEFARAKTCLKDAVTEHCTFDADAMEILQSAFDSYNPFCNVLTDDKDEIQGDGYSIQSRPSNEEALDATGQCSVVRQLNRTRQCITQFIKSLQADPQGDCSAKYSKMQDCIVCVLRSCLEEYGIVSDANIQVQLEESVNQTSPKEFYCSGMLEAPKVSSQSQGLECGPGFFEAEVQCLKEFNNTFTANFSDSSLCGKFTEAKRCLRDLITGSCPNDTRTSSLEFAIVFDDYNPFCQGNTDQDVSSSAEDELSEPCLTEFQLPTKAALLGSNGATIFHFLSPLTALFAFILAVTQYY